MDSNAFIVSDALNMEHFLLKSSVDLSIIKSPYHTPGKNAYDHTKFMKTLMEKITKSTKIGGICCLIVSDDMTKNGMDMTETQTLFKIQNDPEIGSKWVFSEQIVWVKSQKTAVDSLFPMEDGTAVSFNLTPFSTIWILIRVDNEVDRNDFDISDRINKLKISEVKKQEMFDSMWFIPQKSEVGYKDHIPKELIIRLIMIFSKENDLILDPFSGNGITAIACHTLNRNFICIEKKSESIDLAKKRFNKLNKS